MIDYTTYIHSRLQSSIEKALNDLDISLTEPRKIATCVKYLADQYATRSSSQTAWDEKQIQVAYIAYFLPLNVVRVMHVVKRALQMDFFTGLERIVDIGSGLGSVKQAFRAFKATANLTYQYHESHPQARALFRSYFSEATDVVLNRIEEVTDLHKTVFVYAYVVNESPVLLEEAKNAEAIFIVEPARQKTSRHLMQWREVFLKNGYALWGPCTHHDLCPLLSHSKNDWCHDRVNWELPVWLAEIAELLPMQPRSLNYSYLLARRKQPLRSAAARITGDLLQEKGKQRQLVCRGSEREFITLLKRHKMNLHFERGDLVDLSVYNTVKVQNEIRIQPVQSRLSDYK